MTACEKLIEPDRDVSAFSTTGSVMSEAGEGACCWPCTCGFQRAIQPSISPGCSGSTATIQMIPSMPSRLKKTRRVIQKATARTCYLEAEL